MSGRAQFRLRVYRDEVVAIGPGKVALLEAIAETGSISAAAKQLGMSYRRAWMLVEELNQNLKAPAVGTLTGGAHGGGTVLTAEGEALIRLYRGIETRARDAVADELDELTRLLAR